MILYFDFINFNVTISSYFLDRFKKVMRIRLFEKWQMILLIMRHWKIQWRVFQRKCLWSLFFHLYLFSRVLVNLLLWKQKKLNLNNLFSFIKGNLLVLYLFVKYKTLRTKTNYLLCNLAIADFLVSIFCVIPAFLRIVYLVQGNNVKLFQSKIILNLIKFLFS